MRKQSAILCFVALLFSACGTVSTIPIDDAYHWPEKQTSTTPTTPITPIESDSIKSTPTTQAPAIEYLNVQDTTVTIRIKK